MCGIPSPKINLVMLHGNKGLSFHKFAKRFMLALWKGANFFIGVFIWFSFIVGLFVVDGEMIFFVSVLLTNFIFYGMILLAGNAFAA